MNTEIHKIDFPIAVLTKDTQQSSSRVDVISKIADLLHQARWELHEYGLDDLSTRTFSLWLYI